MDQSKKIKVLNVVAGMNMGGAETWLMHVLRNIDRQKFQLDFMVHITEEGKYDEEIRALGGKIIPVRPVSDIRRYPKSVKKALQEQGPYDIIHCHRYLGTGLLMRLARQMNIPCRITHFHNTRYPCSTNILIDKLYRGITEFWIKQYATLGLACSKDSAEWSLGKNWHKDPRWRIFYCGLDFSDFHQTVDNSSVRQEFSIPTGSFVVGHVGRFNQQKNHVFVIQIFAELVKKVPCAHLLLVGDGPLKDQIIEAVDKAELTDKVTFAGLRNDVPRLMPAAMDLFLFPSLYEGLGLVLVEAQAAGLPCVFTDEIPQEADIVKPLINRLSLSLDPQGWAQKILEIKNNPPALKKPDALEMVEASDFNIKNSIKELERIYTCLVENHD